MSQMFIITDVYADPRRRVIAKRLQELLGIPLTRSERNKKAAGCQNVAHTLSEQLNAFLRSQTRDTGVNRAVKLDGQVKLLEQGTFAFLFAREIVNRKVCGQFWVRFGVPNLVIDAVSDADQTVCSLSYQPVK